jgi:hypothetical protein
LNIYTGGIPLFSSSKKNYNINTYSLTTNKTTMQIWFLVATLAFTTVVSAALYMRDVAGGAADITLHARTVDEYLEARGIDYEELIEALNTRDRLDAMASRRSIHQDSKFQRRTDQYFTLTCKKCGQSFGWTGDTMRDVAPSLCHWCAQKKHG